MSTPHFFFTVDVEEWFTSTKLISIEDDRPYQAKSDIEENTQLLLKLLREYGIRGTFFFIQDIAERFPELVQSLLQEGHEIALHGINHNDLRTVANEEFTDALQQAKYFFQTQFSVSLKGYRAPYFSIHTQALSLLKQAGFCYDSSVVPCLPIPGWYGTYRAPRVPYQIGTDLHTIDPRHAFVEFPMSVHPTFRIPGLGGYYFRNLGFRFTTHLLKACLKQLNYAMFYIHPWELSHSIPHLKGMPFYMYRRTGTWTRDALRALLVQVRTYQPTSIPLNEYISQL